MKQRLNGLDALRGVMMLLGIVVHSAATFCTLKVFPWPLKDPDGSPFFDYLVLFIHAFRMPLFFVLAGFFARLMLIHKGLAHTISNRFRRIVLPFAAGLLIIIPLVVISIDRYGRQMRWNEIREQITTLHIYYHLKTAHLWFLYYLILIYIPFFIIAALRPGIVLLCCRYTVSWYARHASRPMAIVSLLSLISFLALLPLHSGMIDSSITFYPDPGLLFIYSIYFAFGVILYSFNTTLPRVFSAWKTHLLAGALLSVAYYYFFSVSVGPSGGDRYVMLATALCAAISWFMIYGLTGLFLYHFSQPSPQMQYLARASYWIYITHLPITIVLGGMLTRYPWPAILKFAIIVIATFTILIILYRLFVARTFIGHFLNGRK